MTWSQRGLIPDQAIAIWEVATGKQVASLQEATGCQQILFGSEADIYEACGLEVQVWDLVTGKKLFSFAGKHPIGAIALSHECQANRDREHLV